ncbi:multidrug resistance [Fusarium tjaetaba]|uniref:Multidrug resistance n=1 Tax=Fusarium tjaetaba TaxID=1567544 RepID=A0A8H5VQZ7_9HYPO|nr:multidrug resistance [Fusarium tjaetaba]KAF5632401.1 multidrug resistance [Fusarium tjaetaba]
MRISEGSPYPPSESDISDIVRDVEKEDAIEKLSLLPNPPLRVRCITPSGFRDVAEEPGLPKPTFQHCAYYKLPPDIRRYILILAFGNRRLHMDFSYDYPDMTSDLIQPLDKNHCGIVMENMYGDKLRVVDDTKPRSWIWWGSVCHRLPPDLNISQTGPMTHGGPDGPWADTCRVGEARHCDSWPGSLPAKCRIGVMGWLQSCRQNYAEAIDILYSKNTIIMANEAMITHLPQLLLPQRLASITSIEISWNLKSQYESGFSNAIDEADLKHICALLSSHFPQLRRLYLSLERSRRRGSGWGSDGWPTISLHLDNLVRMMPSLTEHAISLPDVPFDSILYDAKEIDFGSYSEICNSYNQIWRSTDGEMDVIRLPHVDSYPRAPYHIDTSTSKGNGYWILNGSNWPEKEKLIIVPPIMGLMEEFMGLGPHDFDDFEFAYPLEDIPLNFPNVGLVLYTMTVTEVGCMGVKPNMNIMDHTTPEGKILTDAWKTVISKPGGPQRVYWGLESVDISKVWGFFDFGSVEQHRQFAEEYGADAVKDIPKICTYGEFSKHIKMVPSSDVLGSPLTEVILAYFPQDISDEKKESLSSKIQEILRQAFPDDFQVAHAWGVENDFPARSEEGQTRSVLMGFVGFSHSETLGDHQKTDSWKEALSNIEGLEGSKTPPKSFITTVRTQPSLHMHHGMADKATSPSGVLEQEHNAPSGPLSLHRKELDRLDPNRPACFQNLPSELGFIFAVVGSIAISEYFVSGFNIILPSLTDASNEGRTWPAAVINLTTAILILPFARLAEIHSARLIFLCGHAWLIFWSIIAAFSQDSTMLIACRAMQCLGPSAFLSSSVVIMSRIYRPGLRNTLTFSILGASFCIGFYSGIFFSALSAQVLGWKWYFFFGAFFGVGVFIAGFLTIPKSHGNSRSDFEMDWLGTGTVVPGLALMVYALTNGRNGPRANLALTLGIICLALFVYVEGWRASQPLVSAEVFKTNYMSRLVVALFVSCGSFSLVLFYARFHIESVLYTGPLLTTAWFIPLTAGGFILALVGGFALHILNGRRLLLILCLGFLGSLILFSIIPDSGISNSFLYWTFVFPAMILGIAGVDITFNIHNFIIATSLPDHLQAVGGALITSLLYLGMAFWLGVVEMATSVQQEKRAGNLDGTSQCQIGFWTGTGLALIFITVKLQSAKADLTADDKA